MVTLGFLGTGWIGRNRMEAMLATGDANAVAICDPKAEMAAIAQELAPDAQIVGSLDELLECEPNGVVIATPSALHAEQCIAAFESGAAVFCQKPLGRSAAEVQAVLDAARRADRLLGVDLSYRYTSAIQAIRERVRSGELGEVFAADLTFHNAYGPQSSWFWDPNLSGGGCLIDLGVHLVDLALWLFDFPEVADVRATLLRDGRPAAADEVEDFAIAELSLANGVHARIACSWNLSAGRDAVIGATVYGTEGGAEMGNENGSFFDFSARLLKGRERETTASPPDDWGGRAAAEWVRKLAAGKRYSGSTEGLLETAQALDRLYADGRR
ncbi:MAG TPA: Gfo/Idh/MocA family oxidoreductase [Sphingomicrobium sp.]|nr:Gfo/Idh/MocA family oxidoreductase [Sphingomicrobium sp.]